MSLHPLAPGPASASRQVREAARRQADQLSGSGAALIGAAVAVALMVVFVALDYVFNQDMGRLLKVFLGACGVGAIVLIPKTGLLIFPMIAAFLAWVPPLPLPGMNALNLVLLSLFGVFAMQRVAVRQDVLRPARLNAPLVAFTLLALVSIVRGAAFPTGYDYSAPGALQQLFRTMVGIAPYGITLTMMRTQPERRRVAWAIVAALVAESLVTISLGRNGSGNRAVGSLGQSNELGSFLAVPTVLALAMVAGTRNVFGKILLLAAAGAGSFGVMLSLSRGAMLALGAGAVVVAFRTSRLLFLVLVGLLFTSPLWAPDYVIDRVLESQQVDETADEATLDMSAEARLQTWRTIMEVVSSHPLDGVGFDGLGYVLPDVGDALGLEEVKDSSHNTFLRMMGEMGVLGLAFFVWLQWASWRIGDDLVRRARNAFDRGLGAGLCGGVLVMAISSAFGDRFFNVQIAAAFWMMVAIAESALLDTRENPR